MKTRLHCELRPTRSACLRAYVLVCLRARVRACMLARVCPCVRACVACVPTCEQEQLCRLQRMIKTFCRHSDCAGGSRPRLRGRRGTIVDDGDDGGAGCDYHTDGDEDGRSAESPHQNEHGDQRWDPMCECNAITNAKMGAAHYSCLRLTFA